MNEMDELIAYLQSVIEDLYYYVGRAEDICSGENTNPHEGVLINTAWMKLENAILDLENLVQKMIKERAAAADVDMMKRVSR